MILPPAEYHQLDAEPPVCIECGGEGVLVTGREIYPHRPDLIAAGADWPAHRAEGGN